MARVARLAGALLAETQGRYFLVGNPKRPCDWAAAGFEDPGTIDAIAQPCRELSPREVVHLEPPQLHVELEGESLATELAKRMLIHRNASVSERLWLVALGVGEDRDEDDLAGDVVEARWLLEVPERVWDIVRDTVLRCV